MDYVTLGKTGLVVSRACLGAGGSSRLGLRRGATEDEIIGLIERAIELGITLFDTAPRYGTESLIGRAVASRRDALVISSKLSCVASADMGSADLCGAADARRQVEASLVALGTDHIDILHLHGVRPHQFDHCQDVLLPELIRLREAGKVRFLGVTESFGNDPEHIVAQRAAANPEIAVLMLGLNVVNHSLTRAALPATQANNVGVMNMFAVRGALAQRDAVKTLVAQLVASGEIDPTTVDGNDPLGFLLDAGIAKSLTEAAYRYCRHTPGIDVVMFGTGSIAHLEQNIRSILGPPLPERVLQQIGEAFGNVVSATGTIH